MMRALLAVGLALMVSVVNASQAERNDMSRKGVSVSYTHLTLPTIYSV